MSSYKQLTNTPAYNFGGELKWDTKTPSDNFVVLDGSIVDINSAPILLEKIGFIEDASSGTYTTANISNFSNNVNAIVFANNTFVAAGSNGLIATSSDYTNWTIRTSGTSNNINALIFANNTFVYAGNGGVLATSPNAVSWTARTSGTSNNINSLAFANNTFVYVGNNGTLATSPNAITWTARTSGTSNNLNSITHGGSSFVYVGDTGTLATSSNAITWTTRTSGTIVNINSVAYGNNTYVYAGDAGVLQTSSNGVTWTTRASGTTDNINVVSFLNNRFLYGTGVGDIATSIDTTSWTKITPDILGKNYVGGKTFSRAGSASNTSISLTDLSGGVSSSPAANDIVFVAVAAHSLSPSSQDVTGYTSIASVTTKNADQTEGNDTSLFVGYKVMGGIPDTTITIPRTRSSSDANTDDAQTVIIHVWKNVDPTVLDVTRTTALSNSSPVVDPAAITTVSNNTVLMVVGASSHQGGAQTFTASYLPDFLTVGQASLDSGNGPATDGSLGFGYLNLSTPQTYNPAAWTNSFSPDSEDTFASVTFALRMSFLPSINDITYGKGGYFAGRNASRITEITFTTYNKNFEFKLPTITDSSIVSGINNQAYIKLA